MSYARILNTIWYFFPVLLTYQKHSQDVPQHCLTLLWENATNFSLLLFVPEKLAKANQLLALHTFQPFVNIREAKWVRQWKSNCSHILHSVHLSNEASQADFQIVTPGSYAEDAMDTHCCHNPSDNVATSWCQHQSYISCHNVLICTCIHMYTQSLPSMT